MNLNRVVNVTLSYHKRKSSLKEIIKFFLQYFSKLQLFSQKTNFIVQ